MSISMALQGHSFLSASSQQRGWCAEVLTRTGSQERTTFKLGVRVQHLEASLNYEAAASPALALLSVQDLGFRLALHPASLALSASLGNIRAQDGSLPEVRYKNESIAICRRCLGRAAAGVLVSLMGRQLSCFHGHVCA